MEASVSDDSASFAATQSLPGATWRHGRSGRSGRVPLSAAERVVDVGEHRLVEVDAAEALDALGSTERLEAVGGLAQHGGVEGAAAEVVDGDDVARLDALAWTRSGWRRPPAR